MQEIYIRELRGWNKKIYVISFLLLALCSLLGVNGYVFAEGPGALLNMNYTETKEFENGKKTQTSDNLYQNYYLRLDKSITPLISYQLYLRTTLTNSHNTDSQGKTTNSYLRAIEPAMDIFFRNPLYGLDAGYRHLEQWTTANLKEKGRKTTDFYYSRFNITPYGLPSFSLQFDGKKDYDHLPTSKIDTTDTKYSGISWYDLSYKGFKLSYNVTVSREEIKTPLDIISKTVNNSLNALYNFGYNKTFWQDTANVSAGYQGNYVRYKNVQFSTQTGAESVKRVSSTGRYGLGTQLKPEVDTLEPVISLIDSVYNVSATTAAGTINVGQNGKKYHNIGIELFSSTKPVDTLYIYVNKDVITDTNLIQTDKWRVYRSDFNLPNTWTEITILSVTPKVYDVLNNVYRYEIRFTAPQNGLYFRVINMETASINDVIVTEIEASGTDLIQAGKSTDTSTFFTQGININVNLRPVRKLTFTVNYFLNRSDQDPESLAKSVSGAFENILSKSIKENGKKLKSNITRSYGASSTWLAHRFLTTTVRFQRNEAFDNKKDIDMRSDTYSVALNSTPLPALDMNLSFIRTYTYDFKEKQSMNDLYLLTVGAKLYKDVNMITDIGYTQSKMYSMNNLNNETVAANGDTTSSTRYIRGTVDARLTPKLSGNLIYGISRTSGSASLRSNDANLILMYRPGRFISISGSFKITDTDDETSTSEGLLIDWLVLPAIRVNANYEHTNSEQGTIDSISSYFIWYITRFLDFQFTYGYTRNAKEKKAETYNFGGNLTCKFW